MGEDIRYQGNDGALLPHTVMPDKRDYLPSTGVPCDLWMYCHNDAKLVLRLIKEDGTVDNEEQLQYCLDHVAMFGARKFHEDYSRN